MSTTLRPTCVVTVQCPECKSTETFGIPTHRNVGETIYNTCWYCEHGKATIKISDDVAHSKPLVISHDDLPSYLRKLAEYIPHHKNSKEYLHGAAKIVELAGPMNDWNEEESEAER